MVVRCFNCGVEWLAVVEPKGCAMVDRHTTFRPYLCKACYASDGGLCWQCELDTQGPENTAPPKESPEQDTEEGGEGQYEA